MKVYELNMDGLVGSTHNYAGLAHGNIASVSNALTCSNPQAAARQGIAKMRMLHDMGLKQGLLPPHQRPNLQLLHQLGFKGTPAEQLNKASKSAPELLSACYSASSMWTANAATVAPSTDTLDAKVHFTAANLISNLHRQQEAEFTSKMLQVIFANSDCFTHHRPLPNSSTTSDEGAANHSRLASSHGHPGLHLFVYGRQALKASPLSSGPIRYPARQTLEASEAIARKHLLNPNRLIFACQNPESIDQGVFHNDVISVANESVLLIHEAAFCNQKAVLDDLTAKADFPLSIIEVTQDQLSVKDAVESYLFNSQLITIPETSHMVLVAPVECQTNLRVKNYIENLLSDNSNPINKVLYIDLKQSMRNGGGPACLRIRIPLNIKELEAMHQGVLVDTNLLDTLDSWVLKHYRTELNTSDLADPQLLTESLQCLDELTQILHLGAFYPFQTEKTN